MIYIDPIAFYPTCKLSNKRWCHMATDGEIAELHAMARQLGLRRAWFQTGCSGRMPHYDLTPNKPAQAFQLGAQAVETQELLQRCYPSVWAALHSKSEVQA
jgi:hypothetical protein